MRHFIIVLVVLGVSPFAHANKCTTFGEIYCVSPAVDLDYCERKMNADPSTKPGPFPYHIGFSSNDYGPGNVISRRGRVDKVQDVKGSIVGFYNQYCTSSTTKSISANDIVCCDPLEEAE